MTDDCQVGSKDPVALKGRRDETVGARRIVRSDLGITRLPSHSCTLYIDDGLQGSESNASSVPLSCTPSSLGT